MKYSKEQRMEIGRRIYEGELNRYQAAAEHGVAVESARNYLRLYRNMSHLPAKHWYGGPARIKPDGPVPPVAEPEDMEAYEAMTKEELIQALVQARINEARLRN